MKDDLRLICPLKGNHMNYASDACEERKERKSLEDHMLFPYKLLVSVRS
jgi:hypothetical protein